MPNDIFIIQPKEPHCCKSPDGQHSYKIISFIDDSRLFYPDLVVRLSDFSDKLHTFHLLAEHAPQSPQLQPLFEELLTELHPFAVKQVPNDGENHLRMGKAKAFIEKNCLRELSLKEMADAVCLSEFYFNRLFHQCYGLSPYTYYLMSKVKKSQKLLHCQKSVTEAGSEAGFFDQSHFTKEFKKQVGVTPGKFLRDNHVSAENL